LLVSSSAASFGGAHDFARDVLAPQPLTGYSNEWSDSPEEEHERAQWLCENAEPREMLLGAAEASGWRPSDDLIPVVPQPSGESFAGAISELYAELGVNLTDHQITGLADNLADLPLSVTTPMAVVTLAVAEAMRLNAMAFSDLTDQQHYAMMQMGSQASHGNTLVDLTNPEVDEELLSKIRTEYQVAAAALLLDIVDEITPLVEAAVAADEWPDTPAIPDPLGLIRIGSTGDDKDSQNRVIVVDPSGNDTYTGRVGGALPLGGAFPLFLTGPPVGFYLNLDGDDQYSAMFRGSLGGASAGVGVFVDAAGNDTYETVGNFNVGGGQIGVGVFVSKNGDDHFQTGGGHSLGAAGGSGLGLHINLQGNDTYNAGSGTLGYATSNTAGATGFFCDRDGKDTFNAHVGGVGTAMEPDVNAWFVSLGGQENTYNVEPAVDGHPADNNRYWTHGYFGGTGFGVDQ
jgi:hypothetical protein